jgi:hypothetical protein
MSNIFKEANIVLLIFVLRSTQFFIISLICCKYFKILFVFKDTPPYFGLALELIDILLQRRLYSLKLGRSMDYCLCQGSKPFVLNDGHQWHSKPPFISRNL